MPYINPRLVQCWTSVADAVPTLKRRWINASCLLGRLVHSRVVQDGMWLSLLNFCALILYSHVAVVVAVVDLTSATLYKVKKHHYNIFFVGLRHSKPGILLTKYRTNYHGRPNSAIISQVGLKCWLWGILILVGFVLIQLKPLGFSIRSCEKGLSAISVLPGIYFHLSQVKHLRVKCLAQGHNIGTMSQYWEARNMIFLWKSWTKNDSKLHSRQRHWQCSAL